jgi:hypothetical protein
MAAQRVLRESFGQAGMVADAAQPVLKNVKILGLESLNKRRYNREAAGKAVGLYEGRAVNIDHPLKPSEPRPLGSRFGILRGVKQDADGSIRGDLHYNPHHPMAETVKWWAQNQPGALGLSHDAVGRGRDDAGTWVVEEIVSVRAVDLVADPATTKGLYEGTAMDGLDMGGTPPLAPTGGAGTLDEHVANAINSIVKDSALDKKAKLKKIGVALGLLDESESVSTDKDMPTEEQVRRHPLVKGLTERLDRLETREKLADKRALAERVISQAKLPAEAVSEVFRGQLLECKDEQAMKALVEDRRALVGVQRPRSSPQGTGKGGQGLTEEQVLETIQGKR